MESDKILSTEFDKLHAECERLRRENADLRLRLGEPPADGAPIVEADFSLDHKKTQPSATVTANSRPELKVSLFRTLFRGRNDVYPVRWEGSNGRTGYSRALQSRTAVGTHEIQKGDHMQKITPFLWFDDKAEEAMNFYEGQ